MKYNPETDKMESEYFISTMTEHSKAEEEFEGGIAGSTDGVYWSSYEVKSEPDSRY